MGIQFHKYWSDIVLPILRRDPPPTIPQAIVLQEEQVLLVKRDHPALWELPGGGMLPGESPEDTVIREVSEETGLLVDIVEMLGWYDRTGLRAHSSPVYICRPLGGTLRPLRDEASTVRYFALDALPRGLFPWYRVILQHDLRRATSRPIRRTQHVGVRTLWHCILLDLGGRLQFLDAGLPPDTVR